MNSQHECKHQQLAAKNTLLLKATSYMLQMKTIHLLGVVEEEKKKVKLFFYYPGAQWISGLREH